MSSPQGHRAGLNRRYLELCRTLLRTATFFLAEPWASPRRSVIREEPAALVVQTMPQPRYVRTHNQITGRPQHSREQGRRVEWVAIDAPSESLLVMRQH